MIVTTKRLAAYAIVLSTLSLSVTLNAQGRSQGRGRAGGGSETSVSVVVVFRDSDRVAFRDYFVAHRITAQPLPPGIAKNLARGKPLPPGIAKRSLPADLIVIGPKVGKDVSFRIVGDTVVALRGGIVIDIMVGAFK